jgi:hypothetical protein
MSSPEAFPGKVPSDKDDNVIDLAAERLKRKLQQETEEAIALRDSMVHSDEPSLSYEGPFLKVVKDPPLNYELDMEGPELDFPEPKEAKQG